MALSTEQKLVLGALMLPAGVLTIRYLAARAFTGGAVAGGASPGPKPTPGKGWVDADAPRRIRKIAAQVEDLVGWSGLGDFLVAVAWTESRGNANACQGSCAPNAARGWFQLRPKSARVSELGLSSSAIFDEATAVALAAWYGERLRKFAGASQVVDWLALRRGWALPSRVSDVEEIHQRSRETRQRFEQGVAAAGLPESFMFERAFPPGFAWPGIDLVLAAVGRGDVS